MTDVFTPIDLGALRLPSRIIMAPMNRNRCLDGSAPSLAATYFAQRAGAGLQISGSFHVSSSSVTLPTAPCLYTTAHADSWRAVTAAVHAAGGRIFAQLRHAGRVSTPSLLPDQQLPLAPSAITAKTGPGAEINVMPRAMSIAEIADVVMQFRASARLALAAGFDGIELHGGNGYLIDQFLRDGSNRRDDSYGGTVENRARFLHDIIDAVAAVVPPARIGVRLTPHTSQNDMHDTDPAKMFVALAGSLRGRGLAYLHVVEGVPGDPEAPRGDALPLAGALRAAFAGPLILTGGYDRAAGDLAIAEGRADAIGFAKAYLANPDLPERLLRGAALNLPERATFYEAGDPPGRGYVDYPALPTR